MIFSALQSRQISREKIGFFFRGFRPVLVVIVMIIFFQALFFEVAEVTQDSARHVVNMKQGWARRGGFIEKIPGKNLVFFMGDSKIVAGIVPEIFDRENKGETHSYNVALPGLPLAPHYFWLRDYLKKHEPPDYIVLSLKKGGWDFFHFSDYSIQAASPDAVFQYIRVSGDRNMAVNYFLPLRFNWALVKRYLIGKMYQMSPAPVREKFKKQYYQRQIGRETYEHDWEYFFDTQFVRPEKRWRERSHFLHGHRGYYDFREAAAMGGVLSDEYVYEKKGEWGEEKAAHDPFVRRFFDLTARYGIKVILINDYILPSQEGSEQVEEIPESWQELAGRYDHVLVSERDFRKKIYPNTLFSDPLHLTFEGAAQYSSYIAEIFRSLTS